MTAAVGLGDWQEGRDSPFGFGSKSGGSQLREKVDRANAGDGMTRIICDEKHDGPSRSRDQDYQEGAGRAVISSCMHNIFAQQRWWR